MTGYAEAAEWVYGQALEPGESVFALRAAIERGRLRAHKGPDGQWRSTRVWVDECIAGKYRRRG
ncbi:MAG TPA: hypothetical protein VMU75_02250 [Acidimicrobiales bacterium]|nr:hypothetical protein [Acidimicrobiales bacterium]